MRKFKGTPGVWEVVNGDDNAPDVVSDDAVAAKLNDEHSWLEGGQNSYEVFELNKAYEVSDEYKEILFDGETK